MSELRRIRSCGVAAIAIATGLGTAGIASAYTAPYSTPPGITLVDVSKLMDEAIPQFLWRRLGDADGKPLYTYDADQSGRSSCYAECSKHWPPLVADAHARASGDFSIVLRDDHVRQWAYQGKPLYRYAGKNPEGEPVGARFQLMENPAWHDPGSDVYSPRRGWRRAAYLPAASTVMPPNVELDGLAVANGFGFVDASTHMTIYAAPASHKLSSDWRPVRASALAMPVGEFAIVTRKDDGSRQWTYHGEALYTYAGDYAPGEVKGLFTGDRTIQVALAYRNFIPAGVSIGDYTGRGPLMTNSKGLTLYTEARYQLQYGGRETRTGYLISYNDAKEQGTAGCEGDCTVTWKPLLAAADAQSWGFWEVIARPDGAKQWMFKGSPVYSFVGDGRPGDVEGNNRHVIVYGGPQGQIVYSNPGIDPRDPKPNLGKLDMLTAVGPKPRGNEDGDDTPAPSRPNTGAGGNKARAGGGAAGAANPTARARPVDAAGGAAAGLYARGADRRAGAGFYWHTLGLFY